MTRRFLAASSRCCRMSVSRSKSFLACEQSEAGVGGKAKQGRSDAGVGGKAKQALGGKAKEALGPQGWGWVRVRTRVRVRRLRLGPNMNRGAH